MSSRNDGIAVERSICCYDGDALVREVPLGDVPLDDLKAIVGGAFNPADPMFFDCYPLDASQLKAILKYSREPSVGPLDSRWECFVEATEA